MKQPEAHVAFEVYENSINLIGISQASMPNINFIVQQINGAGISGNVDAVLLPLRRKFLAGREFCG